MASGAGHLLRRPHPDGHPDYGLDTRKHQVSSSIVGRFTAAVPSAAPSLISTTLPTRSAGDIRRPIGEVPWSLNSRHAEQRRSLLRRVISAHDIALDEVGRALAGIAIAAAAGGRDGDAVAGRDADVLILREMRRHVSLAPLLHQHAVDAAIAPAQRTLRADAAVIHDEGGARLAAPEPDLVAEPETAALTPGAARAFGERIFLEQHGVILFDHLERRRLGDADGRAAIGDAVEIAAAAIAAAADEIHDIVAPALGIVAAQREIAAGAGGRGEEPVGDRLGKRRKDRLGNALAHLRRAARDRARIFGIEKGALGFGDVERLESAGIDRHLREDMLDRKIDRRFRRGDDAVHRALAGRARPAQIEMEIAPLLADDNRDPERLVLDAVAVDKGLALIGAVGDLGDLGAHLLGGAPAQLGDRGFHRLLAIAVEECGEALLADRERRGLRLDVADALIGDADIGEDDREDLLVERA